MITRQTTKTTRAEVLKRLLHEGKLRDDCTSFLYALATAYRCGFMYSNGAPDKSFFNKIVKPHVMERLESHTLGTNNLDTVAILRHLQSIVQGTYNTRHSYVAASQDDVTFMLNLFGINAKTLSPNLINALLKDKADTVQTYRDFLSLD